MALISRVTRLFRADFHAVLDRVEEPEILLRQAVREMQEDLARDERMLAGHEREAVRLEKQRDGLLQRCTSLSAELDVCLDADEEDLARSLIRRRLEAERSLQLLERRRETLASRRDQLARRLDENRSRYESMRQKSELFDEQKRDADSESGWDDMDIRIRDEDVEIALLKEHQRRAER